MSICNELGVADEWADVEAALNAVDRLLSQVGNLAGWRVDQPVYLVTLIRSAGASIKTQLDILVSLGYIALSRIGQDSTVMITAAGIEAVLGPREPVLGRIGS